jgi:hypothetical protein
MVKPHFLVQQAEHMVMVHIRGNHLHSRSVALLEQHLTQFLEIAFIHLMYFIHILLTNMSVQIHNKCLHHIRYIICALKTWLWGLQVPKPISEFRLIIIQVNIIAPL